MIIGDDLVCYFTPIGASERRKRFNLRQSAIWNSYRVIDVNEYIGLLLKHRYTCRGTFFYTIVVFDMNPV